MKFRAKHLLSVGLLIVYAGAMAQVRQQAFDMNKRLGRGVNMGNAFEAPTETAWGNPWEPSYFRMISELGFSHVRVPIRWETTERSMESSPYTINPRFMDRIREVVDSALRYKLHIIINMHHHDALFEDPAAQKERFLSQWHQISDQFKDYPDSLLFEILNEPHGNLTPPMWNDYLTDALAEIRQTNPSRIVLIGVAEYGGPRGLSELVLPVDEHIILTVHYYNPFSFTHQGAEWVNGSNEWLGTAWQDTEAERESVASEFSYAFQYAVDHNIPIHVGEFGAYSKADMASRERWTTFLARWFEANGMSWAYWEFSAGFGIYNPATQQYVPGLIDALMHNEMPEAAPVIIRPVYTSDFSGSADGWSLIQQEGAAGSLSVSGNALAVSISSGGMEAWHLQLVKNNIPLEQGKRYRLSFSAAASTGRNITFYAGKASSPWNAYSGYNGVTITALQTTYTFTFTMTSGTDPAARLVFDLGTTTGGVNISSVKVEALSLAVTSAEKDAVEFSTLAYPNPASTWLRITEAGKFHKAEIVDFNGRSLAAFTVAEGSETLDISCIPPGMYILLLKGNRRSARIKLVKE